MKAIRTPADFALLGGEPAFAMPLHVGLPNVGDRSRLRERFEEILDRRWFTNQGPVVAEFEQRLAAYIGVSHCIAVCNATVALEIAIRALDLKGEVIVPAFTFVATAHALQWQQIRPVFCDVDRRTHLLDPTRVEEKITDATTGIIGVHLWGQSCDINALEAISRRHDLPLLFDAAHAFGCTYGGRSIGNFGRAEVFSFHATKFLNSFEGGAVATDDEALAGRIRLMTNFGFSGIDDVTHIGTNGKMTEIAAAMGITSLDAAGEFVAANEDRHRWYVSDLAGVPGVNVREYPKLEKTNFQYVVIEVDEKRAGVSRDLLVKLLWAENVLARRYFYPGCHRMEPYRTLYPETPGDLTVTNELCSSVMTLPTGPMITREEVRVIAGLCAAATEHAVTLKRFAA